MNIEAIITTIATAATLLAAIFSPILTAKINNQHQLEMKKIEARQKIRDEVIMGFVRAADEMICYKGTVPHDEYNKWKNVVFIYIEAELADLVKYVEHCIRAQRYDEAASALTDFCYALSRLGNKNEKGKCKNN